jgi:hypothetical protein
MDDNVFIAGQTARMRYKGKIGQYRALQVKLRCEISFAERDMDAPDAICKR